MNELISNALKHAFPDGRHGQLQVELTESPDGQLVLAVSDDGVGLPAGLDPRTSTTLGLQLVTLLTDQLQGTLSISHGNPTRFAIRFPLTG